MSKQLIALLMCSSLMSFFAGFNTLKAQEVLWNLELEFPNDIRDAVILPDDDYIVHLYHDKNAKLQKLQLRDINTGEVINEQEFDAFIYSIINWDENTLFINGVGIASLVDNKTFEVIEDFYYLFEKVEGFINLAHSAVKHPFKNEILLPVYYDKDFSNSFVPHIFNLETLEIKRVTDKIYNKWERVAYSPDGKYYAIAIDNAPYTIELYDANTYKLIESFYTNYPVGSSTNQLSFTPDSKFLLSLIDNQLIKVELETLTGEVQQNAPGFTSFVFLNMNQIIGASFETIKVYNIETGKSIKYTKTNVPHPVTVIASSDLNLLFEYRPRQLAVSTLDLTISVKGEKEKTLYPNPTNGIITLPKNNLKEIQIYNILGKEFFFLQNNSTINISNLDNGIYYLNLNNNTYKLIKE